MTKKIITFIICTAVLFTFSVSAYADWTYSSEVTAAKQWYNSNTGTLTAGQSESDWLIITEAKLEKNYKNESYAAQLKDYVKKEYSGALSGKATEWHRIALALRACGVTDTEVSLDDGTKIDIINKGIFFNSDLGRQGINGYIWALITLNELSPQPPENAVVSIADIIDAIAAAEIDGGGLAMSGTTADPDITAVAVRALFPYIQTNSTAKGVYDRAIAKLSEIQLENGGYSSWGTENSESASQVIAALTVCGIDVKTDSRFSKNGKTVLDALFTYKNTDGGFAHIVGGESNILATQQALYALSCLYDDGGESEKSDETAQESASNALGGYGNAVLQIAIILALIFGVLIINERVSKRKAEKNKTSVSTSATDNESVNNDEPDDADGESKDDTKE